MFFEQRTTVPDVPETLSEEYSDSFASWIESIGMDTITDETTLSRSQLERVHQGSMSTLTLEDAAQIASLVSETPDAETIEMMACEHLLLGMSSAVMDVEMLAAELEIDLEPKEIQQKIERREPMTIEEYSYIQHAIVDAVS